MKKSILLFIVATLLLSCDSSEKDVIGPAKPPVYKQSYIQAFIDLDSVNIAPLSGMVVDKDKRTVDFSTKTSFDLPKTYSLEDGIGVSIVIANGKTPILPTTERYSKLVNEIGDISFNTSATHGYGISQSSGVISIVDTVRTVNITCDKQFDANHPKGSSLNDLFTIYYEDAYSIIKNGYKLVSGTNHYTVKDLFPREKEYPLDVVGYKLNEASFVPHMGSIWYLVLEKEPDTTNEYVFSVSISSGSNNKEKKGTSSQPIKIKGKN